MNSSLPVPLSRGSPGELGGTRSEQFAPSISNFWGMPKRGSVQSGHFSFKSMVPFKLKSSFLEGLGFLIFSWLPRYWE